jgi:hypothetical protein
MRFSSVPDLEKLDDSLVHINLSFCSTPWTLPHSIGRLTQLRRVHQFETSN